MDNTNFKEVVFYKDESKVTLDVVKLLKEKGGFYGKELLERVLGDIKNTGVYLKVCISYNKKVTTGYSIYIDTQGYLEQQDNLNDLEIYIETLLNDEKTT